MPVAMRCRDVGRPTDLCWQECVVVAEGSVSLCLAKADTSEVSSPLGAKMPWAARGRRGPYVSKMGKSPPRQPTACQRGATGLPTQALKV
ncbi:Hypothetical protein SMAX5B_006985 [Scophthalmus maximus]|uniref:Uncharacterized protein n=1 Tax=Scophthalmus maximus TaxID=52904 RepID=A0A2U9AWJ8_SCOMX|nr:Hypothetical protein SMAX5B_006985 [Scophthalmus maximus]